MQQRLVYRLSPTAYRLAPCRIVGSVFAFLYVKHGHMYLIVLRMYIHVGGISMPVFDPPPLHARGGKPTRHTEEYFPICALLSEPVPFPTALSSL